MFEMLLRYFSDKVDLDRKEINMLEKIHIPREIEKKGFLLREGEVCKYSSFVAKGCLRSYNTDDQGREHVFKFGIENWWVTDSESYNTGSPAKFNIQALEDTYVIMFLKEDFNELVRLVPKLKTLSEQLLARSYDASQRRIYMQISQTMEERYLSFITTYPDIFNRVPLHMIASYLGISRESLTRIRQQFARK